MKSTSLLVSAGLTLAVVAVAAPAAQAASTCEKKTGGSSSSLGYTGKNSGNSSNGYTCAYQASSGKKSLKPWQTKSWTSNTAKGYYKITSCYDDEKNVTVSPAYATTAAGSSYTQTATNWDTSKTRHWGGGVLWATDGVNGSQYQTSNCNWGNFPVNLFWQTSLTLQVTGFDATSRKASFTAIATPDGNAPVMGEVGIFRQVGDTPDPQVKDANGNVISGTDPVIAGGALNNGTLTAQSPPLPSGDYKFYAAYAGTSTSSTPPQRGWTAAMSTTIPLSITTGSKATRSSVKATPTIGTMSVVDDHAKAPKSPRVRCEDGQRPLQINAGSPTADVDAASVIWTKAGARLMASDFKAGTRLAIQAVCREVSAPAQRLAGLALGTLRSDDLKLKRVGTVLAGPGADKVTLASRKAVGFGSRGDDRMFVRAARAVADGGLGADRIVSKTRSGSSLLIGGPGRDVLRGGRAADRINAVDGRGGDRVVCGGSKNRVLADRGDVIKGSCASVKTLS